MIFRHFYCINSEIRSHIFKQKTLSHVQFVHMYFLKGHSTENLHFHSENWHIFLRLYQNDVINVGFSFLLYRVIPPTLSLKGSSRITPSHGQSKINGSSIADVSVVSTCLESTVIELPFISLWLCYVANPEASSTVVEIVHDFFR